MKGLGRLWSSVAMRRLRRTLRIGLTLAVGLLALGGILTVAYAGRALHQAGITLKSVPVLTDPSKLSLPGPIAYYSSDGVLLGQRGSQRRVVLAPRQIPQTVRDATIAIEDQRFYQHNGVDVQGAARALWADLRARQMVQGGSTLTMQYVRNVYLNFQKTAHRKLSEVALALQLEGVWTKERILTSYLNTVYYGHGSYGIEAAAKNYFGVPALRLRLDQAALLAGIVQNPSALDPRRHPEAATLRRNRVLEEMYSQGKITLPELQEAKRQTLRLRPLGKGERPAEPGLMELLRRESGRYLTTEQQRIGGLKVYGTFRMSDIRRARNILRRAYGGGPGVPTVATGWVESRSGRVLLLAHSGRQGYFDFSWQARRQPGSTVKAFTAATHILRGGQLTDAVNNTPLEVKNGKRTYTIQPTQAGVQNVYDSLRFSQNPASWRLYQQTGPKKVLALERRFSLGGMDANSAAALGGVKVGTNPMSLAGAFSVFAGNGLRAPVHAIERIVDRIGDPVWQDRQLRPRQLYPNEYARQMNVALRRVVNEGFTQLRDNLPIAGRRQVAGKTGTTEKNGDAWFAGYVPQMAGAVWVGYAKSTRPLTDTQGATVWGSTVPAQTWNRLAALMLADQPVRRFAAPRGVQRVPRVVDKKLPRARELLARYRFANVTVKTAFSPAGRPGRVTQQWPTPGAWQRVGQPVQLTVSTDQRPAPELVGKGFLEARRQLGRFASLQWKFQISDAPLGQILTQSPLPGYPLKYGGTLQITVATRPGPSRKIVKRVPYVPDGSELADLRRQLAEAQNQRPQSTTQLVVPSVIGLAPEQAQLVLSSIGLDSRLVGAGSQVVRQTPAGGELTSDSGSVKLTLG